MINFAEGSYLWKFEIPNPMTQDASVRIRKPRTDDRAICDIVEGLIGYQAVLVAHDLNLFSILAERRRTLPEVCLVLNLARRPVQALLSVCASLGLIKVGDDCFSLTTISEVFLAEGSLMYMGRVFEPVIENQSVYSFDGLKKAVLTNEAQMNNGQSWVKALQEQSDVARQFTCMMHAHSIAPALAWPEMIDLSEHRLMLDIGGGSGAHSVGAALAWPNLRAVVFEIATVCEVAEEYISQYDLSDRIRTHTGDMWSDLFPPADLHFYSDVFHDWPPEKCRALTEKSFLELEPRGRMIIHEMLLNDDKAGPFAVASGSIEMLLWTEGQQYSGAELSAMLRQAGFVEIQVIPTFGYWSIVTGRKP